MSDLELKKIAENAKAIINGYSFTIREDGFISILNLQHPEFTASRMCNCI